MSKKKLNQRLEDIFADVKPEEAAPPRAVRKPARVTGLLRPPGTSRLDRSRLGQAKPPATGGSTTLGTGPLVTDSSGVMSLAFQKDPNTWATLRLVDESASRAWTSDEQLLVKQVADQLSLALENARLFQETKDAQQSVEFQNQRLAAAAEIGRLVTSTLDLDTIFSRTVSLVTERFAYYHAGLFLVDDPGTRVVLREASGAPGHEMKAAGHSLPVNAESIVGKVALTGEQVVVNDTAHDETHLPNPLLPATRAECALPLRVGNRIIGALDIQSTEVDAFSPQDTSVLQILADQVAIAIDNARSYQLAQQAVKEMRELDRVKTQFLANMSHELRTPLNSIIGFSRVIIKGIDGPISDLQRQDLTAIYNAGQHLLGLINDVLDLAKIEAGKMDMALEETNLAEIISSMMSTATGLVKDKRIKLNQNVPEDLPAVRADAIRVRQVLLNLLSNAAKFTDSGEITVEAAEEIAANGHRMVRVSVTDTGPGISEADQVKLFQAFSQVDDSPTRKTGGSGLGLSISQQLIQLQGGRIGVRSAVGRGSTFYFTLPAFEHESPAAGAEPRRVLAIDDDPQVIELYQRYLEPQGYEVVGLTDPTLAKQKAVELQPFAITLDVMMPGMDGWQVLTQLKSDGHTRSIPVIVCSILEQQERGFSLGAADYVLKPMLGDALLNALDRLNRNRGIREVLLVDDDDDSLRLLEKLFQNQPNYKLVLAQGGRQALQRISERRPDAIVLDLFMPDLDGFELLSHLRQHAELRNLPVVIVSGVDLSSDQKLQLSEFGHRMLTKGSLNESELMDSLAQALEHVRQRA